jgi:hypothetical protein
MRKPICQSILMLSAAFFAFATPVAAEITKLTAASVKDIGLFRGKAYREVEAKMEGTAPGGAYAVPVTLVFPKEAAAHNGVAVVDVVNTVTIGKEQFVLGGRPLPLARSHMEDEFLFGTGHSYVAVIWDKEATDKLKNGTIAATGDGYTILADATALARDPAKHLPNDIGPMPAAKTVIAYGYSQTGALLRDWYAHKHNSRTGSPVFDGALVAGAAGGCQNLEKGQWEPCGGVLSDGGKVMVIATEGDVEWTGYTERGNDPNYRVYEIAGVSHIPATEADFRQHGLTGQNPTDFGPAVRAALINMENWIKGKEPPASTLVELTDDPARDLQGSPYRKAKRDTDGNAMGGLRLPHMPTTFANGLKAGAPMGAYKGLDWAHEKDNIFFFISGTYQPFQANKLKALYPDHAAYVAAVAASAKDLAEKRYILEEDAAAYIEAAKAASMP